MSAREEFELAQAVIRGGEKNPKRNLRYYPLKGLVCCGNCVNAPLPGESSEMRVDIYQCTYQHMTAIRSARLVKDTARHGLRTPLTKLD